MNAEARDFRFSLGGTGIPKPKKLLIPRYTVGISLFILGF